jgi:Tfp pilus assembly protein PilF
MKAPVIASIGSRSKARQRLRRAVELAPMYPENRLNLIEALLKWGDLEAARREATYLEELWPEARRRFSDASWAESWLDWEKRFQTAKRRIGQGSKPAKHSG